jgi:hypothetical protein
VTVVGETAVLKIEIHLHLAGPRVTLTLNHQVGDEHSIDQCAVVLCTGQNRMGESIRRRHAVLLYKKRCKCKVKDDEL